jgi:predicted enzyme related to lactoylglutathione lyase
MSRSAVLNVTFDCTDSSRVARFWSEATRWPATRVDMPGNPFWVVAPEDDALPHLVFVDVSESKHLKNRIHLDLLPQDGSQADELERLQALGARIIDDRRDASPGGWVVMADIEGNEFCLEQGG